MSCLFMSQLTSLRVNLNVDNVDKVDKVVLVQGCEHSGRSFVAICDVSPCTLRNVAT